MDLEWVQFRREVIREYTTTDGLAELVEGLLIENDETELAYREFLFGDKPTARQLLKRDIELLGYKGE